MNSVSKDLCSPRALSPTFFTRQFIIPLVYLLSGFVGCSSYVVQDPAGELREQGATTTELSAATGGVVGGGVGTVVGSLWGGPVVGLVLGGLAGAGTGGLIGQGIEAQEAAISGQEETLARQHELLQSQKREVGDLKRSMDSSHANALAQAGPGSFSHSFSLSQTPSLPKPPQRNNVSNILTDYRGNPRAASWDASQARASLAEGQNGQEAPPQMNRIERSFEAVKPSSNAPVLPSITKSNLERKVEARLEIPKAISSAINEEKRERFEFKNQPEVGATPSEKRQLSSGSGLPLAVKPREQTSADSEKGLAAQTTVSSSRRPTLSVSDEGCTQAEQEVKRARNATSDADKLFYFRRALRLCPSHAGYHLETGRVYASIGRREDAESEFRQALDLDQNNEEVQGELEKLDPKSRENLNDHPSR